MRPCIDLAVPQFFLTHLKTDTSQHDIASGVRALAILNGAGRLCTTNSLDSQCDDILRADQRRSERIYMSTLTAARNTMVSRDCQARNMGQLKICLHTFLDRVYCIPCLKI